MAATSPGLAPAMRTRSICRRPVRPRKLYLGNNKSPSQRGAFFLPATLGYALRLDRHASTRDTMQPSTRAALLLIVILAGCTAVYWAGLYGPFLFDDFPNLAALDSID